MNDKTRPVILAVDDSTDMLALIEKAREALKLGITELHIVGGLHPSLPFSYYVDMLKALSALNVERSAAVPAASSDGVSPFEATSGGDTGGDARATSE